MTHSHDTTTPAMSAASHLAKEGGEAGADSALLKGALVQVQRGLSVAKLGLARDGVQHAMIKQMEGIVAAALALPQPSPALAKGGDAVHVALRNVKRLIDNLPTSQTTEDMHELIDAVLSTPTEGPASQDTAQDTLRRIEAMLDGDQGDDDGMQIMPDYPEGAGLAEKVAACIHLLERRRDIIEASVSPDAEADEEAYAEGCGYTGQHFGNAYDDAVCIDGYLWDLDSCDEPGGGLRSGGEIRCPKCNASPTAEGPASQTEGMGGDATKLRENIEAFLEMHRRGVLTPRTPNIPIELLQKALAALTPPETAEAVPPLYLIRKGGAFYRPNSQGYTRSIAEAGRYSLAEAEAITHPNGPNGPRDGMDYIPAPALASDPAPATDDRERLLEASDKLVSIVEGIQGIEFGTFRAERNRVRLKDTKEWVEFYLALTRVHAALATEASR